MCLILRGINTVQNLCLFTIKIDPFSWEGFSGFEFLLPHVLRTKLFVWGLDMRSTNADRSNRKSCLPHVRLIEIMCTYWTGGVWEGFGGVWRVWRVSW